MQWKDVVARGGAGVRGAFGAARRGFTSLTTPGRARRSFVLLILLALTAWYVEEGVVRVREGEVGVIVDNVSGESEVADALGYRFVFPIFQSFFRLDRRIQSLVMAEAPEAGFRGNDAIKLKTKDGSDVSIDVVVSYRMLASGAAQLLRDAGRGQNDFSELWIRPAVRAMVARGLGQLTAENIYNAEQRSGKAKEILETLNRELADHQIELLAIVPRDVRFFSAYEDVIKKKKIKDQETQEFKSQAVLAQERQNTEVKQAEFDATQTVLRAEGEGAKVRAEADGYARRVQIDANGELAKALKAADGELAIGLAEAQGIKEQATALAGAGGLNLVALAYAKKLASISFSGIPVMQDPTQSNIRVQQIGSTQSSQTSAAQPMGPELPPGASSPPGSPTSPPLSRHAAPATAPQRPPMPTPGTPRVGAASGLGSPTDADNRGDGK